MSGERASVPSASDVGLPQLDEEDLGAHRDQRNSGADVARERAPWRDQRDEERGTPDERQQLRGELVAPPRPHHAEADRRRHEQDHGVVHGRESSWSDYFGPNDPLGGNNPSDPQPSYEWTKGHCPYCHGWHDPDDCTKREDKLERTASTYAHYHRMTGRPCTCPWGYRHKRRLAAVHTAGQHYNKLLKTPDKRLNTPEGDRFKELLGQQLERVPEADPLTPWLAQRFKRGDIRHTASSDVNALGYSPWDNFSAYRDDPVSSPLRDDQLRYWSDWYNARQHPTRRGVNVMHPDFGVHQMRQKVAEHQQALSEQRLLDGGLNDPGNRIVQRWPDGWHVTQLGSDEAMEAEGQAMNHCVGSDEQPYKNLASTGDISVYSLRDPRGWPHGTWHTNNNQGGVAEVFGHSDRSLAPQHQEKYEEWAHDNDFDPTPVGHQEHAEDAAIQMPAADDVRSYYDLHGNGDETEYIPHDANYGENTELLHQEPDYYSITDDLYRNRPGVGYVYDAENHRYRGVTPEETREHTFDTADMNGHLPALHSEMMDYQPTGAAEEEVQKHWRQMARTYNNDDLNEPLPLPDVQHTYQFPQPTAPPTPPGQLQFGQPTARTADWNTIRDEGYEAPRWLSDEWDVDDPAQTFKGMPLYWGDHGDCPRCLGAGCAACSQGMVPWPSPNEPRTSEWHLSSKLDWLRGREDLQTPEGRGWLTYLERQHPQADPLYPWLTREWKKGRLYRNAENIYHHAYDVTDPSGRQYSLALDSPTVRHWMDWYNSDHPTRQGVDIGSKKFTVADMHGKIGEWNDDMERRAQEAERQQQNDAPILHQWPDGWTVRNLTKPEHLNYEGESMGHCVGGYCSDVTHGNTAITSLRDPSGVPHATAEFEPTQYDHRFTPQDLEHGLGTSVAAGFDEGLKNQLRDYHANGTWDPAAYQAPEHYADVSALHQQLEDSYGRRIPRLENSRIVQIQGRGNEVPKPEYQQRMKDWFATFPEATRPNWGYDSAINHIGEITNDPTHLPPDDDWDDGGYGPHGDYGLVEPKQPTNYDNVLRSLVRKPMRWQGYSPNYAPEDVRALYDHARKRDEIPHLAQATGDYQRDVASPAFDDHLDNNLDYYPSYPGESLEDDFGHWSEPDPNSYGQDDRTPHERFQDAREDYDEGQQEAIGNVPEMGIVNDIYGYLQPHWNEATSSYENAFPQSKGTFSRVGHSRELHVGLDVPKRIKNQIRKWVDGQDWPAGVELEPISEYHITLLYARDGYDEHDEWVRHTDGYEMTVKGIAQFGDDAIVLTLDSPDAAEHNKDLVDMADNRDLDVSKFPGGYKPHLTIAYGKLPDGLKPPKLKFKTGPSSVSEPREAAWHFADDGPIPSWGQLLNQSETERDSSQGFANGWEGDVYHGTTPEKREQILAQGFDPQAQAWARSHGRGSLFFAHTPEGARYGPAMIKAHVKLNKPMTFWWDPNLPSKFPDIQPEPGGMVSDPPEAVSANWGTGELAELAKRTGHDGAIYPRRDEMQVFDPSAIVSAEPYDPDAKQSKTAAYYHVAPRRDRESILEHGLDYSKATWQWRNQPDEHEYYPYGNYLTTDPSRAYEYAQSGNNDLYEVDASGHQLTPDPDENWKDGYYTTDAIHPSRLKLVDYLNQPIEHESKTAAIPSEDELAPFCNNGECYEWSQAVANKWPNLERDAGFYIHPNQGPGDHAWNVAPDGTVVDTTAQQHEQGHPIIIPPDHPYYPRYVSWTRHAPQAQQIAHEQGDHYDGPQWHEACPACNSQRQSKTAMAERSGIPELDRAIDEFMQSEFKSLETTVTDLNEYREPHNAHGQCEVVADALAEFLKERGFKAYATSDELSAFPGYEDAQLNEESYPDHAMVEVYGLPGMGVNTVTIDFTASQYGFVEFPKIEGGKLGKTAAQPTTMYHVSPGRNHQSIMSRGLFPPGQGGVKGETEALAPGIYLYHNYDYALQDSYERFEEDEQPRIYAVNVDGLSLQGDPTWNDPKTNEPMASYSTEPILPERLRLLNERQNKTAAYPDETEYGNREFWQPNDTAHYEYHCHRGHDSADAALWYRSHQPVTVLHRHPSDLDSEPLMEEWGEPVENPTAKDRMEAGMPYGYQVRWPDGHEGTAMEDELFTHPRHFDPNGGPPPVQEVAQHDPQYAQWLTQRQSKTAARPYYRWLPTAIRDDVQQSGMSPNPATGNPMHFWDNLENAQRYGEIANLVEPHDLWQVQGRPGRLKLDPWFKSMPYMYPEYGSRPGAWQSDAEHIEPERLQLWTDPSAKMSSWRFAAPLGEDFFNSVMQGEQAPGTTLSPQDLSADPEAQRFRALQQSYRGPFDAHIETSIPDYARNTMDKGAALARAFPGQRLLDIGSSTGAFGKALSQLGMQTTNLDPSREMTQHFQQTPSTLFDEHAQQSFGEGYTDNEGDWIEPFKPGQPYDIVHQSMAFQFIGPEREQQINHAKSMMHPGGIFLIEEKVRTANEDAHEAVKDQWKSQFYSPDQLADKQEQIGFQPTSGMTDQLVHQDDLEQILQQHFASVVQYWSSGNFKGYAASDNPNNLAQFLQHYRGQSNPQFAAEQTPRMLGDGEAGSMPQQPATSHLYTRGSASNLSQPDNWLDDRTSSMERTTMDSMDSSTDGTDNPINCTDNSRDSTDNRTDNPIQPSPHRDPHTHTSQHTTHTSPVTDSTVTIDTTLTDSTVTAHWAQRYSTARSTPALRPQRSEHTSQHTKGVRHVSYMGTQNGLDLSSLPPIATLTRTPASTPRTPAQ